jgi:hypothetical protein
MGRATYHQAADGVLSAEPIRQLLAEEEDEDEATGEQA